MRFLIFISIFIFSCKSTEPQNTYGCTDENAENYNPEATVDDGTCDYSMPVANAGDDQVVDFGITITLDGTGSYDTDGTILGYSWVQESGPLVDIDNYEQAVISFTVPNEFCELQFSLQVFDNEFNFSC